MHVCLTGKFPKTPICSSSFALPLKSSVLALTDGPCDLWTSHYPERVTRIELSAVMAASSTPEVREQREIG